MSNEITPKVDVPPAPSASSPRAGDATETKAESATVQTRGKATGRAALARSLPVIGVMVHLSAGRSDYNDMCYIHVLSTFEQVRILPCPYCWDIVALRQDNAVMYAHASSFLT